MKASGEEVGAVMIIRLIIMAVCCVLWPLLSGAQVSCADWNTGWFFKKATAEDVTRCVHAGADVKARSPTGSTPLHTAAWFSKSPAVIEALVDAGANLEARNEWGFAPLHLAAEIGTSAVVAALLDVGANQEVRTEDDWTPLHSAASSGALAVIGVLLARGADLEARSKGSGTPLHIAAAFGESPAVIKALLEAGADPKVRAEDGKTPWDLARKNEALKGTDAYWWLNDARFE